MFASYILPDSGSSFRLLARPSAEVLTWLGDHVTKKSLLKSPAETTEAIEIWINSTERTPIKKMNLEAFISFSFQNKYTSRR